MTLPKAVLLACILLSTPTGPAWSKVTRTSANDDLHLDLRDGWELQSAAKVTQSGAELSNPTFKSQNWYRTSIPSTVLATLEKTGAFGDIFYGTNLRAVPGMNYPDAEDFTSLPMPDNSPFRSSWWYRTSFPLPVAMEGRHIWLHFGGINYSAQIWVNGKLKSPSSEVVGMFRSYDFDITELARPGQENALAVEIFPPTPDDLSISWIDWNPAPADKNMGIWRGVSVEATGQVAIRHPQVVTLLPIPNLDLAHLTVNVDVYNGTSESVQGRLEGEIEGIHFSKLVTLGSNETRSVSFSHKHFRQLNIRYPRLWWPAYTGDQNLYPLKLSFVIGEHVSDKLETHFGIRQVTSELTDEGNRLFRINGKKILIRGGGWAPDLLLRDSPGRDEDEIRYVRDLGLNTIRLEGKPQTQHFYELCDRYGVFIMAGWSCCDKWERGKDEKAKKAWTAKDFPIAAASLETQAKELRIHPSVLVWLNGSDEPPPSPTEKMYLEGLKSAHWANPILSSASDQKTPITGESGVKMTGPYDYIAPNYWLLDHESGDHEGRGGAFGFNTETSPGPSIPPIDSLRTMLPPDHLWPIDDAWTFHAGGGVFKSLKTFTDALEKRYGASQTVDDFALKAQVQEYESHRAMFEAYGRNKYISTGVIQWMLNNAWPSMIWNLYDYYLRPGGSYFGAKKANEPVHIQYSYDDRSVVVVNNLYHDLGTMQVDAKVLNLDMSEKYSAKKEIKVAQDSSLRVLTIPELTDLSGTYFIKLALSDADGKLVSSNLYWLSTSPETLDWAKGNWYQTPTATFADFSALGSLAKVGLVGSEVNLLHSSGHSTASITLKNPSQTLAFSIRLKLVNGDSGAEVLPVIWEDNYFSLLPGEKKTVTAIVKSSELRTQPPIIEASGWNINAIRWDVHAK